MSDDQSDARLVGRHDAMRSVREELLDADSLLGEGLKESARDAVKRAIEIAHNALSGVPSNEAMQAPDGWVLMPRDPPSWYGEAAAYTYRMNIEQAETLRRLGVAPVVPLPDLHARALGVINEFRGVMQWSGFNMNARLGEAIEVIEALMQNDAPKRDIPTDTARLDSLEAMLKACPHARVTFNDDVDREDDDGDVPMGYSIRIDGCDPLTVNAPTLREALDIVNAAPSDESSAPKVSRPWCPGCNNQGRPFVANRYPEKLCAACAAKFHGGASEVPRHG